MTLTLTVLRCPQGFPAEARSVADGEFSIGRGSSNHWVLVDPARNISGRHCVLARNGEGWEVADLSTNGTFVNSEALPIGRGAHRILQDGDRLRIGGYEFGIQIAEDTVFPAEDDSDPDANPFDDEPPPARRGIEPPEDKNPFAEAIVTVRPVPSGAEAAAAPDNAVTTSRSAASDADALIAAFLQGAGLPDSKRPSDPVATVGALGAAFRALVVGLRRSMAARSAIKREFRLDQTEIRSQGNNPLKFSIDDQDALATLIGSGRRTEMSAADAVADALRDIRLHELATIVAMQAAVRRLLEELSPAQLRRAAEGGLLPMQRKAHAWEAFEAAHARITEALSDDFENVFGRAFADAYQRALSEVSAREDADG